MVSIIHGVARAPIQVDEDHPRSTLKPDVTRAAELDAPPDFNEHDTSFPDTADGLARHQVGGYVTESEQYAPFWSGHVAAGPEGATLINEQVSTSGTAASRESGGMFGHGTMMRTESIEPVIRDGAAFGADYFTSHQMGANETGGNYMTPVVGDPDMNAVAQSFANQNARTAAQSSMYASWYAEVSGNG